MDVWWESSEERSEMKKESMGVQQVICMKGGVGEGSYARNSKSQVGFSLSLSLSVFAFFCERAASSFDGFTK